jgi:uncharacterized protein
MLDIAFAPFIGLLVGLIVGLTGVGGGALLAPILLLFFGLDVRVVIATDLVFAAVTKSAASIKHFQNYFIDWQILKRLWLGSIPATALMLVVISLGFMVDSDSIISIIGIVIIVSGMSMLISDSIQSKFKFIRINSPVKFKKWQAPLTVLFGYLLGSLVTLTSLGAGALGAIILRLLYPLRMKPHNIVGTDTLHAIPVTLLAGSGFFFMGFVNLELLFMLLLGSIPGALVGSTLLKKTHPSIVKLILSLALILAGFKIIY